MLREANHYENAKTCCDPTPIDYVDNSLYLDDATVFVKAVNINIVKQAVRQQLELVNKIAFDQNATPEDLYEAVSKFRKDVEVFAKFTRIKESLK